MDSSLNGGGLDRTGSRDVDVEDASKALRFLVSAKIMDGSRKGSTVVTDVGLKSFIFTEAFIATLPPALLRKCVAQRLEGCPRCRMKGFALDVWSTGALYLSPTPLISTAQDFVEIFPASILTPPSSSACPSTDGTISDLTLIIFQVQCTSWRHLIRNFKLIFSLLVLLLISFYIPCRVCRVTGRPCYTECLQSLLTVKALRTK